MSFKASLAVVLQLHHFRNIDLPHKARFALQVHLYQRSPEGPPQETAMPFNAREGPARPQEPLSRECLIDDNYFRSRKFNIEYQDQVVRLEDSCEWRMALEGFPLLEQAGLTLEFILIENHLCWQRTPLDEPVDFKEAERYRFRLQGVEGGIMQYCEGEFAESYYAQFGFTLFAMVTDYRFQPYRPLAAPDSARLKSRTKVESLKELMGWGQKHVRHCEDPGEYFYRRYVEDLRYNSVMLMKQCRQVMEEEGQVALRVPDGEGGLREVGEEEFFSHVRSYTPVGLTEHGLKQAIHQLHQDNFSFVQRVSQRMAEGKVSRGKMVRAFEEEREDMFGERVIRSVRRAGEPPMPKEHNAKVASQMRKHKRIREVKVVDEHVFSSKDNQHYAFLEVSLPPGAPQQQHGSSEELLGKLSQLKKEKLAEKWPFFEERDMLVMLCHGFQACSVDMDMLKRQIGRALPAALVVCSTANEHDTNADITLMGKRLADEVVKVVDRHFEQRERAVVSFVGHSMGGIIARASLPFLQDFHQQLGFYCSLSSPHLGYLNGVDTMIKAGLWFMRTVNKVPSLDQLSMEDADHSRDTFLFRLSQVGHLRHFQKVVLLSSSEDSYVPWHSARVEAHHGGNKRAKLEAEMVDSILGEATVHRVDIHFDLNSTKDLNSFIGRTAHINLLTQECIMKLLSQAVPSLFQIAQL